MFDRQVSDVTPVLEKKIVAVPLKRVLPDIMWYDFHVYLIISTGSISCVVIITPVNRVLVCMRGFPPSFFLLSSFSYDVKSRNHLKMREKCVCMNPRIHLSLLCQNKNNTLVWMIVASGLLNDSDDYHLGKPYVTLPVLISEKWISYDEVLIDWTDFNFSLFSILVSIDFWYQLILKQNKKLLNSCTPTVQTIIPLEQLISVRGCYCTKKNKWNKKLLCDCFDLDPDDSHQHESNHGVDSGKCGINHNNESKSDGNEVQNEDENENPADQHQDTQITNNEKSHKSNKTTGSLTSVKLFYAIPVGEYRWKVTSIPLYVTYSNVTDHQQHLDWISNVTMLLDGEYYDRFSVTSSTWCVMSWWLESMGKCWLATFFGVATLYQLIID